MVECKKSHEFTTNKNESGTQQWGVNGVEEVKREHWNDLLIHKYLIHDNSIQVQTGPKMCTEDYQMKCVMTFRFDRILICLLNYVSASLLSQRFEWFVASVNEIRTPDLNVMLVLMLLCMLFLVPFIQILIIHEIVSFVRVRVCCVCVRERELLSEVTIHNSIVINN